MNKLIYAIGIAIATTFAANNTKTDVSKTETKNISTENIEEIPSLNKTDSLKVKL
ncbi:MAG: hypothetical protein PF541_00440 [Prolixibacteraceae bacterium]|jgi:hypothetical protein|nr:hypothetical protein [Prolixibacteraceae bacterium]